MERKQSQLVVDNITQWWPPMKVRCLVLGEMIVASQVSKLSLIIIVKMQLLFPRHLHLFVLQKKLKDSKAIKQLVDIIIQWEYQMASCIHGERMIQANQEQAISVRENLCQLSLKISMTKRLCKWLVVAIILLLSHVLIIYFLYN